MVPLLFLTYVKLLISKNIIKKRGEDKNFFKKVPGTFEIKNRDNF